MQQALLINFVGGWAILPAANYHDPGVDFPYWIMGTSLPSDYFLTKATIVGLTGLLGVLLFDRQAFRRFQLTVWDLPMGLWLAAPLLSAFANPGHTAEGWMGELYLALAWGSPYLIGRLYFTDTQALRMAAKAIVMGGRCLYPHLHSRVLHRTIPVHAHLWLPAIPPQRSQPVHRPQTNRVARKRQPARHLDGDGNTHCTMAVA